MLEFAGREVKEVKKVLIVNGYKKSSFPIPKKKVKEEYKQTESPTANKHPVCIPYISGLSEQLQRVFKFHGVPSYHKPLNTVKFPLVPNGQIKQRTSKEST